MVVVSCAVQEAPVFVELLAPFGVQVTGEPRFELPFWNCTVPVGPWLELLVDPTTAVRITCVPELTTPRLLATDVVVCAGVIVTLSVLLIAGPE